STMGNAPLVCLSNGHKMPQIGLGTWQSDKEGESEKALSAAIDIGYRLFDTAPTYMNEEIIGKVMNKYLAMGNLKREEFFITTKIWPTHLHPDRQLPHFQESLKKLNTPYVDLLLAHQPTCYEVDGNTHDPSVTVEQIWQGLEKIYKLGLAKAIGVSNWSIEQMERARAVATVPIHAAQVECHIYLPQFELVDYCKKHKIIVTSYGSLGSPARKIPFNGLQLDFADSPNMFEEPAVVEIAEKYKRTPAQLSQILKKCFQVLLRYLLDRGICIIPKSASRERLKANRDVVEFHLDDDDIKKLNAVPHRQRLFMQEHMKGHPEDSFAAER
ncbi:hypothetical protein PENTCL1PPCAC_28673, partial [Pristionchus entomophagus]